MICLGIESTAHSFGVSIVSDKKILSNIITSYKTDKGGMIPGKVADHHIDVLQETLTKALEKANKKFKDIDLIAFSQGPGIGHSLRIVAGLARSLSLILKNIITGCIELSIA